MDCTNPSWVECWQCGCMHRVPMMMARSSGLLISAMLDCCPRPYNPPTPCPTCGRSYDGPRCWWPPGIGSPSDNGCFAPTSQEEALLQARGWIGRGYADRRQFRPRSREEALEEAKGMIGVAFPPGAIVDDHYVDIIRYEVLKPGQTIPFTTPSLWQKIKRWFWGLFSCGEKT